MNRSPIRSDPFLVAAQVLVMLKLSLVVLVFDPRVTDTFTLPKSLLSHELTFLVAAAVLLLALVRHSRPLHVTALHYAVGALLAAFLIATPFAVDTQVALFGADRRYLGLVQMIDAAVMFAAVAYLFRTARDLVFLALAILGLTVIVVTYALLQRVGLDPIQFRETTTRPISTFGQPDFLAPYVLLVAATAVSLVALVPQVRRSAWLVVAGVLSAVCLYIAYAAGTRSGILALAGAAAAALLVARYQSSWNRTRLVVIGGAFAIGLGILLLSPLASRITPAALQADNTVAGRLEIWGTALRMTASRPILGLGPDNFAVGYPRFRSPESVELNGTDALQNNPHNWLLFAYTSAGAVGAAAMLVLVLLPVPVVIRLARAGDVAVVAAVPLYGYLAQGLVNVNDIGIDWILWSSLGVIAGASRGRELFEKGRASSEGPRAFGWMAAAVLVLAALGLGGAQLHRLQASEDMARSRSLTAAKRPVEAVAAAAEATRFDPARGHSWGEFATALAAAGAANAAQRAYLDAASREPWQPLWWRNAGFQALAQQDETTALSALQHAIEADPYDYTSLDLLSRMSFNRNELARALEYGTRAVRLRPSVVATYDAPAQAALGLHRNAEAEQFLLDGIRATNSPHLRVLLARVYLDSGNIQSARTQVQAALTVAPNDPEVLRAAKDLEGR